jgi:hypothetical protein
MGQEFTFDAGVRVARGPSAPAWAFVVRGNVEKRRKKIVRKICSIIVIIRSI